MIVVSDKHITAILRFAHGPKWHNRELEFFLQDCADVMKAENIHRYNEHATEQIEVSPCEVEWSQPVLSPLEILKLIETYERACAYPPNFFPISQAARLVRGIRYMALAMLPGYDEAPATI